MALYFLLCVVAVLAKQVSQVFFMGPDTDWRYLTKFAMDIGKGDWSMKVRFNKPIDETDEELRLKATIYLDDNWQDVLNQETCDSKVSEAKRVKNLYLPYNGDWSKEISGTLSQKARPHVWFFALSDCEHRLEAKTRLRVEVTLLNTENSQFSLEERGLEYIYPLLLVFFSAFLFTSTRKVLERYRRTEEIEGPQVGLVIAISAAFLSLMFMCGHIWAYSYNGQGFVLLDFLAQALEVISQLVLSVLFILLSSGWTLKYREYPEADIYIPVTLLVTMLHVLIVGFGRITDDSHYKFSDYEGEAGMLLVLLRVGMWLWFVYCIKGLLKSLTGRQAMFTQYFSVLASAYFLALPVIVVISWGFVPYARHKVVTFGTWLIQVLAIAALSHLFSEKSSYYKMSTMSSSVLPGKVS
jgi:hypothetical protein